MKTVIEMAHEAGIDAALLAVEGEIVCWEAETKHLERFAEIVRADAIDDEREACAKVCESGVDTEHPTVKGHIMKDFGASSLLAAAIRARSNI